MQGRYQFSWQAAEGQKRFCLESFSFFFFFFVRCASITFTVHIKRMSYPRQCASSLGLFGGLMGFYGMNQTMPFLLHILVSLEMGDVKISVVFG